MATQEGMARRAREERERRRLLGEEIVGVLMKLNNARLKLRELQAQHSERELVEAETEAGSAANWLLALQQDIAEKSV
jgi:hypothetical protein